MPGAVAPRHAGRITRPADDASPRRGRRAGGEDTRAAILAAARAEFARDGYDGASLRAIARAAGVDPALVHHYFDGKPDVFVAAMQLPVRPQDFLARVVPGPRELIGVRVATAVLGLWESPATRDSMLAVLRSAMTHDTAARMLREFVARELFGGLARELDVPDPDLHAALAASQMVGLAMLRYVVAVEPLSRAGTAELVALVAPTLQRYLAGGPESPGREVLGGAPAEGYISSHDE